MNRASRSSWLAAIGIVVAVVALWRPGLSVTSGAGYRLVLNLPEWLTIPLAVAALLMCIAMVTPRRSGPDDLPRTRPPLRRSPVGILLVLLLLAGTASTLQRMHPDILTVLQARYGAAWSLPEMSDPTNGREALDVPALDAGVTMALLLVAVAMAGFALLVIGVSEPWAVIARLFRFGRGERPAPPQELAAAIADGMRELELGDDPRRAVIACYRRCEAALAVQRRRRYLAETPREFMRSALAALALPADAVRALLLVFERARFSELPVTEADRSVALGALGEIRSALVGSDDGSRA